MVHKDFDKVSDTTALEETEKSVTEDKQSMVRGIGSRDDAIPGSSSQPDEKKSER